MKPDRYGAIRNGEGPGISKVTLPLGTIVIRKANKGGKKVRMIKIRMDGPTGLRFVNYSRWWWEKNRGPIPPGKLVLHKDGRSLNDRPGNLVLGGPADKLKIVHADPEWSRAQHERCGRATGEWNRFHGKLNRLGHILKLYWYPILDSAGIIFNVPFRKRKPLLAWFGIDVSAYPMNGSARKFLEKLDASTIRPVRGLDLESPVLETYLRIGKSVV